MTGDSEGPPDGDARKIVELDLRYETMRELQNELAPLLSNDGLFIPREEPVEADSVVRFRVMLPEDFTLIEGTGVVVWTRRATDEKGPPGVAVRWASLPSEAQETIDAIIDAHLASGGVLFNLEPESEIGESFPTDALDHRSLDERGTVLREPASAADALGDLERARLEIRGGFDPVAGPAVETGEGTGGSVEDDYFASVEAQVQEAIASVRDQVTQVTEPVDPDLIELTTDVEESAVAPTEETPEPGAGSGSEAEDVIPDFLDKWRHEVEAESEDGGKTERLDFEPRVDEAAAAGADAEAPDTGDFVASGEGTAEPASERRWWLVAIVAGIALGAAAYVIWLWSFGGEVPGPTPQAIEQGAQPSERVIDVTTVEQVPESELGAPEDVEEAPLPAPTSQPSVDPATAIDSIAWSPSAEGTEVVIQGNGTIAETTLETFGLSEPPRILVRIRRIQQEYGSYELTVGTPEVERIRIGHHPELTPPALYVVLDLARPDVHVSDVSIEGDTARVTVQ